MHLEVMSLLLCARWPIKKVCIGWEGWIVHDTEKLLQHSPLRHLQSITIQIK